MDENLKYGPKSEKMEQIPKDQNKQKLDQNPKYVAKSRNKWMDQSSKLDQNPKNYSKSKFGSKSEKP